MISYGSVRKFDPEPLKPLLSQLFLRATFAVRDACLCDEATAREQVQPGHRQAPRGRPHHPELVDTGAAGTANWTASPPTTR